MENETGWRLKKQQVAADGRVFDKPWVAHPGSVVLVPLMGDDVLMISQYRPTLGRVILELPAGTREWAEAWLPCAQRELREETGYRAERFDFLGEIWPSPGLTDELMRLYVARDLTHAPLPMDEDEQIELQPMPLAQVLTMALRGDIRDAKTVAAIVRTDHWLRTA